MLDLAEIAKSFGIKTRCVSLDFEALCTWLDDPGHCAILHLDDRHFAPALSAIGTRVTVCDAAVGVELVGQQDLFGSKYRWGGEAMLLETAKDD